MSLLSSEALPSVNVARTPDEIHREWMIECLMRHGRNSMSTLLLYEGFRCYRCVATEGFIGYIDTPRLCIAIGEPVCAPEKHREVAREFVKFCESLNKDCCFLIVTDEFTGMAKDLGFLAIEIGEDFIFDVQTYAPRGNHSKKVRSAVNQVRKRGAAVRQYNPSVSRDVQVEDAINEMARRWMRSRNFKIKGYFIGLRLFDFEALKRYFYVEYEGHTVAGLACSPIYARNGYLLEDLMRDPDAPNGVSELMVLEAIRIFREEGRSMATFGISPRLALGGLGNLPRWSSLLLHPAATVANRVLGLNSLHHHREKFDTRHMEKCFLVKYPRRLRLMDLYGLLKTFNSTGTIFG